MDMAEPVGMLGWRDGYGVKGMMCFFFFVFALISQTTYE